MGPAPRAHPQSPRRHGRQRHRLLRRFGLAARPRRPRALGRGRPSGAVKGELTIRVASADVAHILIADDDPDVLQLVTLTLELEGHRVVTAKIGEEAVRVATENRPDVIVLDVMMPKMDGVAAVRR